MTEPPRKRLSAQARRGLIEQAAARLFAEHGYAGTTLNDIAAAAGVTKPMLYRHFSSKQALHLALLARHWRELQTQIVQSAGPTPSPPQLPAILDAWFAFVEQHPYAWRMLFRDTTGDPVIQAFHQELHSSARALTRALIETQPEVEIAQQEIEPLAEIVRSATTGLALWWVEHPTVARETLVEVMSRVLQAITGAWTREGAPGRRARGAAPPTAVARRHAE